ncbi:MAG: amino acid carrier protein [Ruminococcus sp.]|jgi:AGCS family alanine or glycine:cation symporter|nr:amino acid carrier protein [Ruminococcus sp.]
MLEKINLLFWGYGTIALILVTGIIFSVKIGFLQLNLPKILRSTIFAKSAKKNGEISRFQALSTALAASMGTGNIVGVAAAISLGGAGAVFWMWVSAFFGMGTAYAENYLGVVYKNKRGKTGDKSAATRPTASSGALTYLEHGLGAKPLAVFYAVAAVLASFGVGNMTQSNAISGALSEGNFGAKIAIGIVTAIAAGAVIIGGAKRIAAASEKIIPIISLFYIVGAVVVIALNYKNIPYAFESIFRGAFGISAVGGGISGTLIKYTVTIGLQRGIFSNEAGMGSSVFVHTETDCKDGAVMGMWAMAEVFIDTLICCSVTALVILTAKTDLNAETITVVSTAFEAGLGQFAGVFIKISSVIFAFATILGWSFYGEKAVFYLTDKKGVKRGYIFVYLALVVVGAVINISIVWQLSDIFNALMLIPNLIGILYLAKEVKKPL